MGFQGLLTQEAHDAVEAYARRSGRDMPFAEAVSRMLEEHATRAATAKTAAKTASRPETPDDAAVARAIRTMGAIR